MKKVLAIVLAFSVVLLAGCGEFSTSDLNEKITVLEAQISLIESANENLISESEEMHEELHEMHDEVHELHEELHASEELIEELQEEVSSTNSRIKNALDRENWAVRKVKYNADWTTSDAEYCLGVFDEDWSTLPEDDFKVGEGLKFVITVETVSWGTEIFVKDSCGNYSEFVYQSSPFSMYSMPTGLLEEGKTYEVVLYKEMYFTEYQLGFLPLAEMGEFGAYPEDLSGIIYQEVE